MVRNISKSGELIKDISKVTVPINDKTLRAYELIAKEVKNERKEYRK